ncbi:MAG TPA: SprT family zinc-dependent metalloprotease [Mariprofundaceae bacterium]|nr:SprT family zinc-dependent metalloprotease [Mariprofundaceae bacterium]
MAEIDYSIVRRPKRKTLCISIHADNSIEVLAPAHMSASRIATFVQSKSRWIEKKRHFNSHVRLPYREKLFVNGETLPFLGMDHVLKLESDVHAGVEIVHGKILVRHRHIDNKAKTAALIESWYREQALQTLVGLCTDHASRIGVKDYAIGIKNYRSRWGSCHHDGRIYFNWRIIMAPKQVVAYIVVHEMCHLVHHNHSRSFWQLVEQTMPDYREAETWLKINGLSLAL